MAYIIYNVKKKVKFPYDKKDINSLSYYRKHKDFKVIKNKKLEKYYNGKTN
jgi:hypothetical protein